MAQKTWISLVDDLDGTEGDETVLFGLDGVNYQIDLSESNAAGLRDALATYIGAGRRAGRSARGGATRRGARRGGTADAAAVRDWGRENGYKVSERGRISAELAAAYADAH